VKVYLFIENRPGQRPARVQHAARKHLYVAREYFLGWLICLLKRFLLENGQLKALSSLKSQIE